MICPGSPTRFALRRPAKSAMNIALVATILGALLPGCASFKTQPLPLGMDRAAVLQRMGTPQTERTLEDGLRLEFPGGPYGVETWFVYLDAAGRVSRSEQVLTESNFDKVVPQMEQDAVLKLLGRPGEVQKLGRDRGVVWSYRYDNQKCQWFQAEISAEHTVRSAGMGTPPECLGGNDPMIP